MVITTLAHHIDLAWMYEAYRQTRKDGALGIDKVSAQEYAADLESNLMSLLDRFKTGTYFDPCQVRHCRLCLTWHGCFARYSAAAYHWFRWQGTS